MNSVHSTSRVGDQAVVVTQVAERQWHALEDDQVIGRGDASRRPDGRIFLSIDSWQDAVFDQLAEVMLADLSKPLYTVVDEADIDLTSNWQRAGFTTRRREWEYVVSTDPQITGLDSVLRPEGVRIIPVGAAQRAPLGELYNAIRDEVQATIGWDSMPAEVLARPDGISLLDLSKYAVAAESDRYVGLVRVVPRRRQARIGLVAVRADLCRHGIARALLAHVLGSLHRSGIETAWAEVDESNGAAMALFEGLGARRASSNLELVRR
ncbi:GNAT family N-acetyltransferase [Rugosimonospora africana]|uniref:Ribosomal-protein-alanine N-acetyltransferase n=1 Tax=Rugosimonospora africana TaxID=556532 RepID=A0A8J3QW07_9ACTN|nr:GNAT family N-acetyltransferase [Rugosimonospora africana]GIH17132.1 ribosomal-protein-alanine N-acetyltransferase [Rugosimonospora africana]